MLYNEVVVFSLPKPLTSPSFIFIYLTKDNKFAQEKKLSKIIGMYSTQKERKDIKPSFSQKSTNYTLKFETNSRFYHYQIYFLKPKK